MREPNYILRFNDGVLVPKNETKRYYIIRNLFLFSVVILILGVIALQEFLLKDSPAIIWIFFVAMAAYLLENGGRTREKCYSEIWFYDEYFVHYVPKRYYSKNNIRKEYFKMYYKDVKKCIYRTETKKIDFFGVVEGKCYKYDKAGEVKVTPSYHKVADSITNFYTVFEPDIDFVEEIETHSPIKVILEST